MIGPNPISLAAAAMGWEYWGGRGGSGSGRLRLRAGRPWPIAVLLECPNPPGGALGHNRGFVVDRRVVIGLATRQYEVNRADQFVGRGNDGLLAAAAKPSIPDLQRWTLAWRLVPPSNLGLLWIGSRLRLLPRFELLRQVSVTPLYNGGVPRMLAFVTALAVILSLHPLWSFDNIRRSCDRRTQGHDAGRPD
jgi:hypothetical protein